MPGTYADALAAAQQLAAHLRAHGVAVSIELQVGVSTSGWLGGRKYAEMSHHTVSRRSQGLTPCLALVKRGRPDVPGPLCNGYGGFDEVYRIITMGWANHPGAGGPLTVAGVTIPANNARPYVWGTEYEGGLDPADWTDSYRAFMGRANAAILEWLGRPVDAHLEHKTWAPTRKIDRLGYTAASGRAEILAASSPTPPPPEDDMFEDSDRQMLREALAYARSADARAAAATAAAQQAAAIALDAVSVAAAAVAEVQAARGVHDASTARLVSELADVRERIPHTATYGVVAADSYQEVGERASSYAELSGVSAAPVASVELDDDDLAKIGAAVPPPVFATHGTFVVESGA